MQPLMSRWFSEEQWGCKQKAQQKPHVSSRHLSARQQNYGIFRRKTMTIGIGCYCNNYIAFFRAATSINSGSFTILAGWWLSNPSEKYESQWEGWHPIYEMESHNPVMFQTTNQLGTLQIKPSGKQPHSYWSHGPVQGPYVVHRFSHKAPGLPKT